jgi:glycosyltransferase involved in cell wall biosynthesis
MGEPKHVAFLLHDIDGGGAERLTIDLMAGLVARGVRVDLLLQSCFGEFMPLVPPEVTIIDLAAPRIRSIFRPLRQYLNKARPDCLVAAMWPYPVVALAARALDGHQTRIIVSEHSPLSSQYGNSPMTMAALQLTMRMFYPFASGRIGVSRGVAEEIARFSGLPLNAVSVVHNPIPPPLRSAEPGDGLWQGKPGKRILTVGRLKAAKNQALLLDAFALHARNHEAVLAIVGAGSLADELQAQAVRLGIADQVLFPGFRVTPGDWYGSADLFALSSDYEGFGNVLVEALHCGLPVVSTDCPHGPAEVLGNGRWGRLVPVGDAASLAAAMAEALAEPVDVEAQKARAADFSVERAVDGYWQLMQG